ncbi:lycopene cyclase domain-containing protein [Arthrobacter sp. VKM Ac-2550]|uniref:lycopene cyclase domain-containing protein n=1 Tax=Crystallibacter permensis TaxID=1938888 RepID=UPI002227157F|nr:lycopene cyclase domain-containing protein [Arthrobacter sp. VKM Ac-2550]MCW2135168.1 lycopene cyclase domain-containing protein [Arthrobacter sp. VKM Ac-2550]
MTYLLLNLGFLALAAAVALVAALVRRRRVGESRQANQPAANQHGVGQRPVHRPRKVVAAVVLSFLALCVLTAVFDNLMIAAGLFKYSPEHTSGWRIGLAPLEDFAYVLAAAVLLPAVWSLLPAGKRSRDE